MTDDDRKEALAMWQKAGEALLGDTCPERVTLERLQLALARFGRTLPATSVGLGIPCARTCEQHTLRAAMSLCFEFGLWGLSVQGFEVAINREVLVDSFAKAGVDRMLFLDSDTVIDGPGFWQLMGTMDRTGAAVVAALVKERETAEYNAYIGPDGDITRLTNADIPSTGVAFPVRMAGIAAAVLDLNQIRTKPGPRFGDRVEGYDRTGEDTVFAKWIEHHGFDFMVDPKVQTLHFTQHPFGHVWPPQEGDPRVNPGGAPAEPKSPLILPPTGFSAV